MRIFISQHCRNCPCKNETNPYEKDLEAINNAFDETIAEVEKQREKAKGMLRLNYCRRGLESLILQSERKDKRYPSDHPFNTCSHDYRSSIGIWEACIKCGHSREKK